MILCFEECLQMLSAVEEWDFTQPLGPWPCHHVSFHELTTGIQRAKSWRTFIITKPPKNSSSTKPHFGQKNQPHTIKIPGFFVCSLSSGPSKDSSQISLQIPSETKLRLVWLVRLPLRIVETARSCLAARLLFRDPKPRARGEVRRIQTGWPFWEIYTKPEGGYVFVTFFGVFSENSCEF